MTVTKISEINKNKVRVYIDDEPAFVLYKGELRIYHVKEGGSLSEEDHEKITKELLPRRAKMRAMNLLKARPYTERGLTDKLRDGEYPEDAVFEAISYVKGYGYIDDEKYALEYVYTYKERRNKRRLTEDLLRKGVSKDLIEKALIMELGDDAGSYEEEQIKKFLSKKNFDPQNTSYEEKQKLLAALYRKGFSQNSIIKIIEGYNLT